LQEIINQSTQPAQTLAGGIEAKQNQKEVFYSPASEELVAGRVGIFAFSFKKSQERLNKARRINENPDIRREDDVYVGTLYKTAKEMTLNSSQFGDDRPLSCVRYAPNGNLVATGSLSAYIKIWDVSDLGCVDTLRGHEERITSVSWNAGPSTGGMFCRYIVALY
jgi:U4/U6 small nuclear ribonucleoprotein PRP4